MRQTLYRRLQRLEEASTGALNQLKERDSEVRSEKLKEKIESILLECGVEQQSNESTMDALARAVEMSSREFRQFLATGIDPTSNNLPIGAS